MSRVDGEPVAVWVRGGRPARFVWRGRLYAVLGVLDHWVVSREWWRYGPVAGIPAEREFWRVEASPGRGIRPVRYELVRDTATWDWRLARAWD